jgi:hypothetical protein
MFLMGPGGLHSVLQIAKYQAMGRYNRHRIGARRFAIRWLDLFHFAARRHHQSGQGWGQHQRCDAVNSCGNSMDSTVTAIRIG